MSIPRLVVLVVLEGWEREGIQILGWEREDVQIRINISNCKHCVQKKLAMSASSIVRFSFSAFTLIYVFAFNVVCLSFIASKMECPSLRRRKDMCDPFTRYNKTKCFASSLDLKVMFPKMTD